MAAEHPAGGAELGLRERKKAQMRQHISDVATLMFIEGGFDTVRVADIAARVGVSEKTVFNYFPTKESLVFDQFDEQLAGIVAAVASRAVGVTPTRAYVVEIARQMSMLSGPDFTQIRATIPRFLPLIRETPQLRAAWGDHRDRMVGALATVLADELGLEADEPEPLTAARALVSLSELLFTSVLSNFSTATSGEELMSRVLGDLERGARLVETGTQPVWREIRRRQRDHPGGEVSAPGRLRGRGRA